jgi:glucosamine-phosphate N-acetyltransferase
MEIKLLTVEDIPRWIEIVRQLSPTATTGALSDRSAWFDLTQHQPKVIFVAWLDGKIVGTASVLIEEKVNRGTDKEKGRLRTVAHVEEVVVDSEYRGKDVGKELMEYCINFSKLANAYKVILDCSEENIPFYEKCGFKRHEVSMRLDI